MSEHKIWVVDSFTSEPFGGNPAGVVLEHGDDAWMQNVAAEMKHSETAFVRARDDGSYDLRWFTPEVEVSLCGHATLASAHVLYEVGLLARDADAHFHTKSGILTASDAGCGGITLDFPAIESTPTQPYPALSDALGITPIDFLMTEPEYFLFIAENAAAVRAMKPDFAKLHALGDVGGVYVSARANDGDYDIVSRFFGPKVGIDEDPVTGSMHCVLAAYWCPRLGVDRLNAYQASPRGGSMLVQLHGDRVLLTGNARTVLRGEFTS